MSSIGIIPARYQSSRLPGKPLKDIDGLPMIVHVAKRSLLCKQLDAVVVATDNVDIKKCIDSYSIDCHLTSSDHPTGTDRVSEVAKSICSDEDIIVNIQGDEPLLDPDYISKSLSVLTPEYDLTQPYVECSNPSDPADIKLVFNLKNEIMYFSRNIIPSFARVRKHVCYKQVCISSFWKRTLDQYVALEQTPLEKIEYIELLRCLENRMKIIGIKVKNEQPSVDTPADLDLARKLMKTDCLRKLYG